MSSSRKQLSEKIAYYSEVITRQEELIETIAADKKRMRTAGTALAEAALHVVREYDGTHRLSLAVAEWSKAVANEGGRGERHAPAAPIAPEPAPAAPGRALAPRWPSWRGTRAIETTPEDHARLAWKYGDPIPPLDYLL